MNNLNSVLIEGHLAKDPELSYTSTGRPVGRLRIGCNRSFKKDDEYQQEASFFDITVWGRQAEVCSEHLEKGRGVRVVGRLKEDRWQDQEGNNRSKVQIVAEHVEFMPKPAAEGDAAESQETGATLSA
jgi:single-strand DNA-binding protein